MATYETWFLATDAELDRLFPGWGDARGNRADAALPVWRQTSPPVPPARPPSSDYLEGLEGGTPPGLRSLPHFRWKNSPFDLIDDLAVHLGYTGDVAILRKGPPESEEEVPVVQGFPDEVLPRLGALSDEEIHQIGIELEGALSEDDLENKELYVALRTLAQLAKAGEHLCLFITL